MSVYNKVYHERTNHISFQEEQVSALDKKIEILRPDLETSKNDPNFYLKKRMVAVATTVAALSLAVLALCMPYLAFFTLAYFECFGFLAFSIFPLLGISGCSLCALMDTVKNSVKDIFRNKQNDELELKRLEQEKLEIQGNLDTYKKETKSAFTAEITRLEGDIKAIDNGMKSNESQIYNILNPNLSSIKNSYEWQLYYLKSYNQNVS